MSRSFIRPNPNNRKMPKLKFCGITNAEDAILASQLNVNYLGLIFVENTSRYIDFAQAKELIQTVREQLPKSPKFVGVFQNASVETMQQAIDAVGIDIIQCHGEETIATVQQLSAPCIKVLTLEQSLTEEKLQQLAREYADSLQVPFLILDLPKNDPTNETLHQRLKSIIQTPQKLQHALHHKPYFLAGKLTIDNVPDILSYWCPQGLDIASGIERSPGKKDLKKMKVFIETVQHVSDTL